MFRYFMIMGAAFTATAFLVQLVRWILTTVGYSQEEAYEHISWLFVLIFSVYIGVDVWLHG